MKLPKSWTKVKFTLLALFTIPKQKVAGNTISLSQPLFPIPNTPLVPVIFPEFQYCILWEGMGGEEEPIFKTSAIKHR